MPDSLESAVFLLVLIGPGFIAAQVKNSLVPHLSPSNFRETVEALVLSALLLPVWLLGFAALGPVHGFVASLWGESNANIVRLVTLIFPSYLLAAPFLGCIYAAWSLRDSPPKLFTKILEGFGITGRAPVSRGPELWDKAFHRPESALYARVTFEDGSGFQGMVRFASAAPAKKQLLLVPLEGERESLVRFDSNGVVTEDLSRKSVTYVWVDVDSQARSVEIY